MTEAEILLDIKKRHSPLHEVDALLTAAMEKVVLAQGPCYKAGLRAELNEIGDAIIATHRKVKELWEAGH